MTTDLAPGKSADLPASTTPSGISLSRRVVGGLILGVCLGLSLLLTADQLDRLRLPGCSAQSSCQALTAGPWGKIAGWPVSFLGVAYFAGLLAAWLLAPRGGLPVGMRWIVRLGLAASFGFAGIMYWEKTFCAYCAAVHAGNVAFWMVVETTAAVGMVRRSVLAFVCTAAAVSAALGLGQNKLRQQFAALANVELEATIRRVILVSRDDLQPVTDRPVFRGRFVRGPAQSPVRLVIFTDYQCAFCRELDRRLTEALASYDSMSYSVRHCPLCPECNPGLAKQGVHANACRAAWAVEAAGLLRGSEGFWAMHRWLFEHSGTFTDEELTAALGTLGFDDAEKFLATMQGEQARANVERDVQEADQVGVSGTPTLYVNGVQVMGLKFPTAVPDLLASLQGENLPPRTAEFDRPPLVVDRRYEQWLSLPVVDIPTGKCRWKAGPADAPIRIALFIDCLQRASAPLAARAREWAAKRGDVRVEFYHFPFSEEAHAPARLVEAAGRIGGQEGFWRMHDWFCENGEESTAEQGLEQAESLKLDRQKLAAEFARDDVRQAVDDDIQLGVACRVEGAPRMYVNGRPIDEATPPKDLLEKILAGAKAAAAK